MGPSSGPSSARRPSHRPTHVRPAAAAPSAPRLPSDPPSTPRARSAPPPSLVESDIELEPAHQAQLLELFERAQGTGNGERGIDHYALLGVPRTADKKAIKRAYFELAARVHPDKFFRKKLGSFKLKMEAIFGKLTEAYETLTQKERRADYDAYLTTVEKAKTIEAMVQETLHELERAEEAARRSVPISSAPPRAISSARAVAPPMPSSIAATPKPEPRPAQSPGSLGPPNLGAFIADALGTLGDGAQARSIPPMSPSPARPSGFVPTRSEPPGMQSRREMLARRLTGNAAPRVPQAPKVPSISQQSPAEAVEALKRRYEDRIGAARAAQAKKYAEIGASERAKNDLVAAANAYRVAVSFAPDDLELKAAFDQTSKAADEILSEAYLRQAQYEERSEHWAEAAKSWARVAKARPEDAKAPERAAHCLVKADGNLHEAAALAQRAAALKPRDAHIKMTLANVYLAAGLTLNAKRELEAAAQLAPDDGTIQALLRRVAKAT
jgi:hypothetical protein